MTPIFIRKFRKSNKCQACKSPRLGAKSLCEKHLVAARLHFRAWTKERKALGKCLNCDRKGSKGCLRCVAHLEEYRARSAVWGAKPANKAHVARYAEQRKAAFRAQGRCFICPKHSPLDGEYVRCIDCRTKHKALNKKSREATR